ncbi:MULTISPECIES: hypothetical protein [unclassified Streptomyces]|uniref:hypothetical protein n=1 Tax=unclassified Streptomyces TaxID=2593676 RepID=UPI0038242E3A
MYMINVRLARGVRPLDDRELRRSVRAVAGERDGLQHVYAEVGAEGAELVLFVTATSQAAAHAAARRVVSRSLRGESLRGWAIREAVCDERDERVD